MRKPVIRDTISDPTLQDDWKITPALTFNLGLRWDYFPPYSEGSGRQANFIADGGNGSTGTLYIPTEGCNVPRSASFDALLASSNIQLKCVPKSALGQTQLTNFSPRVGFAYQFLPKTVIRGGYGIAYGALANTGYSGTLGANYPFEYTVTNNSSNSYTRFLASNGQTATVQNAFAATDYNDPTVLNGLGLNLIGRQFELPNAIPPGVQPDRPEPVHVERIRSRQDMSEA